MRRSTLTSVCALGIITLLSQASHSVNRYNIVARHAMNDLLEQSCQDTDRCIALPTHTTLNQNIASFMRTNNISMIWIDAEIISTFWHSLTDKEPLYDQGCYSIDDLPFDQRLNCATCSSSNATFYAYSVNNTGEESCFCVSSIPVTRRLPESYCQTACQQSVKCGTVEQRRARVVSRDDSLQNWRWVQHDASTGLCAAHRGQHDLSMQQCTEMFYFYCMQDYGPKFITTSSTWFKAKEKCENDGGHMITDGKGWTNIKAFELKRQDGGHIAYTNWAEGQPDFRAGTCITMSSDGYWRTGDCSQHLPVLCVPEEECLRQNDTRQTNNMVDALVTRATISNVEELLSEHTSKENPTKWRDITSVASPTQRAPAVIRDNALTTTFIIFGVVLVALVIIGQTISMSLNRRRSATARDTGEPELNVMTISPVLEPPIQNRPVPHTPVPHTPVVDHNVPEQGPVVDDGYEPPIIPEGYYMEIYDLTEQSTGTPGETHLPNDAPVKEDSSSEDRSSSADSPADAKPFYVNVSNESMS